MASFARQPDDTMTRQQDINGGGKTADAQPKNQ